MHDILFDNQLALTDADLTEYGDRLGLQVWTDLDRHRERVQSDRDKGERAGVSGTPPSSSMEPSTTAPTTPTP